MGKGKRPFTFTTENEKFTQKTKPICLLGAAGHYRNGNLDIPTGITFGLAGILGALSGTLITGLITPEQLKTSFGVYFILLAMLILIRKQRDSKDAVKQEKAEMRNYRTFLPRGSFYGFIGGVISGTFGTMEQHRFNSYETSSMPIIFFKKDEMSSTPCAVM